GPPVQSDRGSGVTHRWRHALYRALLPGSDARGAPAPLRGRARAGRLTGYDAVGILRKISYGRADPSLPVGDGGPEPGIVEEEDGGWGCGSGEAGRRGSRTASMTSLSS